MIVYPTNNVEGEATKTELRLYARAANKRPTRRWNVTDEQKDKALEAVDRVLSNSEDEGKLLLAARALEAFERQNQTDEHLQIKLEHDAAKPPAPGAQTLNIFISEAQAKRMAEFKAIVAQKHG